MSGLKNQIARGVFWNAVQLVVQRSFSFIIKLVLARLLFPEDFGIIGMAAVFTSFVSVFNDLGIGAALVQKKEEILNEGHYHTAFWTGIVWSIILYLLIAFIVAPLAADFYDEPIISQIIPVLSIGILSSPINLIHRAQLTKDLDFKKIAFISNAGTIFSGILSLFLAYLEFGVWALVFNSVASIIIGIPLYFKATGWIPKFHWSRPEFDDIFGFGIFTTGTNVFNNIISKLDYLIIGKLLSASLLGVYTLAFLLTDTFRGQLMSVMNKVMYPIYGKLQDQKKSLKNYYLKIVFYNSVVIYPIMVFLMVLAKPFIFQFFGEKWVGTIIPLKILSAAVMFQLMVNSHTSLIRGIGKPKLEMQIQLGKAILVYIPSILIGTYYFGIVGASVAVLITKIVAVFIAQFYLHKLFSITLGDLLKTLKAPLIGSVISLTIGEVFYKLIPVHYIFAAFLIFITYIGTILLLARDEFDSLYKLIKTKFNLKKIAEAK
jgi:teichuronic acid exporter